MRRRARSNFLLCATLIASTLVASVGSASIEGRDKRGFGDGYGRTSLGYSVGEGKDFVGKGLAFDLALMGFFEKTHFDTLIGAELDVSVGGNHRRILNDGSDGKIAFNARAEAALDLSFLHWNGSVPGRFVIGGGFGADYDDGRELSGWPGAGRTYPLIIGRFQLRPSRKLRVHLGYRFLPTTSSEMKMQEHRFELAVGMKKVQAGVRHQLTVLSPEASPRAHEQQTTFFIALTF